MKTETTEHIGMRKDIFIKDNGKLRRAKSKSILLEYSDVILEANNNNFTDAELIQIFTVYLNELKGGNK